MASAMGSPSPDPVRVRLVSARQKRSKAGGFGGGHAGSGVSDLEEAAVCLSGELHGEGGLGWGVDETVGDQVADDPTYGNLVARNPDVGIEVGGDVAGWVGGMSVLVHVLGEGGEVLTVWH